MSNNEMIEYKDSFTTKIKNFFKRLFGQSEKKSKYNHEKSKNQITEEKQEIQSDFFDSLKVDTKFVNAVIDKKIFLDEITGNEEALNLLSIDRLKKLEKYYDSVIEENDKKIKKLKATALQ